MDIEQRTDEWFAERLGKATASRFKDILTLLKSNGESAARKNYRAQLVVERITGERAERFTSSAMEWGTLTEDLARLSYTLISGNTVDEVGFVNHPTLQAGASPDGLVGDDGTVEIKCFQTANHIQTLKTGKMPFEHMPQVQGQLWITGRKWCDFISFEPTLPKNAQLFITRVLRDDEYIAILEAKVTEFMAEVTADIEFLNNYKKVGELR